MLDGGVGGRAIHRGRRSSEELAIALDGAGDGVAGRAGNAAKVRCRGKFCITVEHSDH